MRTLLPAMLAIPLLAACGNAPEKVAEVPQADTTFQWEVDQFEDLRILRYQIPGFESIPLQQKKLAYYLTMSGLAGRDIMWDQNYRHNLSIRKALESIVGGKDDEDQGAEWDAFMNYAKQVWFANGIHHHYSNAKFIPQFSRQWFELRLGRAGHELPVEVIDAMFDPTIDAIKVSQAADRDLVLGSASNFYGEDVSQKEVEMLYAAMGKADQEHPLSYGINSKVVRGPDGKVMESFWKVGGQYGAALEKVVYWLELAKGVALNPQQEKAIGLLIDFYKTGDLQTWDDFNVAWVQDTKSDVDVIHGFVEVYNDPMGMKGSYEVIVQMKDPEASATMSVLMDYAGWFEENSPIMPEHKRSDVVGITYNFINVIGEAGDASPSTPVGVNLPNADWIRAEHGSKSISLGNIGEAYEKASGGEMMKEFAYDEGERERAKEHGSLAGKLHTALHEVIGHASGVLEKGVSPDVLKNYASPLEEARADLVALYFITDPKMQEIGLVSTPDVGRAEYEGYLRNGLMLQLRRLKLGDDVQQAHMRNRQTVSKWVLEKGSPTGVVTMEVRDGKHFVRVNDVQGLRALFGEMLREVQRIKSQGDYEAAKALFETYGVKVDQEIHAEVLKRSTNVKSAPYSGFVNPDLVPVFDEAGNIIDVKVVHPKGFVEQMLDYGERFGFLPEVN